MENMVRVIQRGARETVAAQPHLLGCPDCGEPPAVDPSFYGQVCIYCDNDFCSQQNGDGWPQVMAPTLAEAAKKWNSLGEKT